LNTACGHRRAGQAIGTLHTHAVDDGNSSQPSVPDQEKAKEGKCGDQHYIISKDKVIGYFSDGHQRDFGDRATFLPKGVKCNQEIPPEVQEF